MASVPQKTLNWLWDVLRREYRDPQRTYSDLAQALSRFPGFSPRTDVYTYENGAPALLVHLLGVVPVPFRGSTYRYPIAFWIPHAYPHDAPMIYVTPTEEMIVRPGQHVSGDGRVYHHYLAHWREAWDRSNVVDFLSILADIFAKEPPVMSKQQMHRSAQQPLHPSAPPRPPLPGERQRHPSQSSALSPSHHGPPRPPPKQPVEHEKSSSSPLQIAGGRYDAPPPLPGENQPQPRPPSIQHQYPQGNGSVQQPSRQSQYIPQRGSSLGGASHLPQQWQDSPVAAQQRPASHTLNQQHPPLQQPHPLPYSPQSQQYQQGPPPQQQQYPHHHHLQHHQALPAPMHYHTHQPPPQQQPAPPKPKAPQTDLLSSPFDIPLPVSRTPPPVPPIPRNPEKDALLAHLSNILTTTLHNSLTQSNMALGPLQSQNQALQNTLNTLNNETTQLKSLQETLNSNISLLRSSLTSATTAISSAHARAARGDIPKVDEMLTPPHVSSRQLYDVVTEERGLDAAIFALQEAFVRGRVSAEVWQRRTRELARERFRRRWVGRKVGRGMGLEV